VVGSLSDFLEFRAPGARVVLYPIVALDDSIAPRYYLSMIQSFACKETEKIFHRERSRRLPGDIQKVAQRKLWMLDAAVHLHDLRIPPNNCLEALKGNRKGQHSIRINQQWRICFTWRDGRVYDVEIADYH